MWKRGSSKYDSKLEGFCGIVKDDEWDRDPNKIDQKEDDGEDSINHRSDRNAPGTENDAEDPSDDAIIPIERLEKKAEGDLQGK